MPSITCSKPGKYFCFSIKDQPWLHVLTFSDFFQEKQESGWCAYLIANPTSHICTAGCQVCDAPNPRPFVPSTMCCDARVLRSTATDSPSSPVRGVFSHFHVQYFP